jgi:hypothetical protein
VINPANGGETPAVTGGIDVHMPPNAVVFLLVSLISSCSSTLHSDKMAVATEMDAVFYSKVGSPERFCLA